MNISRFLEEFSLTKEEVLADFMLGIESREVSNLGQKEVFLGRAKFGIFGEGKEVPQLAMARFFQKGDIRAGYYRDQTFMFAIGAITPQQMFAQLYAHPDIEAEPMAGGRMMTGHFGTPMLNADGSWKDLTKTKNSSADLSPTAAQMPRLVGLAYASKLYRENKELSYLSNFSKNGDEIAFGTIGNASTSEGHFFEAINAAGVLQIPMLVSVWDDEYGISVPAELQTTKGNISKILAGFQRDHQDTGYEIFTVNGWDYPALIETYDKATRICREEHIPVLVHVTELTQPGGHSTSGSHKRYKSQERLNWEEEYDCIPQMRKWILDSGIATPDELNEAEELAKQRAKSARQKASKEYRALIDSDAKTLLTILEKLEGLSPNWAFIENEIKHFKETPYILLSDVVRLSKKVIRIIREENHEVRNELLTWHQEMKDLNHQRYSSALLNKRSDSALNIQSTDLEYDESSETVDGREVVRACFDKLLERDPRVLAFGEDVGKIGDVNQGFAGLQDKYGDLRVIDTGIRECTIIGQAIGLAQRGLKPIAEIQYLDYIMYAIQILSDDLATLQYRSYGTQKAPVIVRTRGHRLEGVWHSGSPLGTIINSIRGVHVCVPRNMTQAAGFYNTLIESGDPAVVIECLNAYRLKEKMPSNIEHYKLELGKVETLREGTDITIVTYGSMCRIVMDAAINLSKVGIDAEVIDVQTLLPFDLNNDIVKSLAKTNRVLFADEDVPGGTTAFMMQHVLEFQGGYYHLDSKPKTISSWAHRPAYATDGDYFSKPNAEDVFDYVYDLFSEDDPKKFTSLYS